MTTRSPKKDRILEFLKNRKDKWFSVPAIREQGLPDMTEPEISLTLNELVSDGTIQSNTADERPIYRYSTVRSPENGDNGSVTSESYGFISDAEFKARGF